MLFAVTYVALVQAAPLRFELRPLDRPDRPSGPATIERRPDMLPDGIVVRGRDQVRWAWLTGPTRRYAHGVLGDAVEASGMSVETAGGKVLSMTLGPEAVFEDRFPRAVDMDGSGGEAFLVVKSYIDRGAALALVGIRNGRLVPIAESDPIGSANRWLNPVGAADFDGDGRIEAAHVETPHIGGVLVLTRFSRGKLDTVYRVPGFSNHRIGSRELGLSAILDADSDGVPDIVLPDRTRSTLRFVSFAKGRFRELGSIALGAEIVSPIRVTAGVPPGVSATLSDGRTVIIIIHRE